MKIYNFSLMKWMYYNENFISTNHQTNCLWIEWIPRSYETIKWKISTNFTLETLHLSTVVNLGIKLLIYHLTKLLAILWLRLLHCGLYQPWNHINFFCKKIQQTKQTYLLRWLLSRIAQTCTKMIRSHLSHRLVQVKA